MKPAIETSNLNYLLNGQSPLYFLWLAPDDEIRYAWARDEWRRLDVETPGWREKGTIAVRFERVLNFEVSALPQDAMREISDGIKSRIRFNAVTETGVPGFIPIGK